MRTKAVRITEPQLAMLEKLAAVKDGSWLSVSGHAAAKCFKLAEIGFAHKEGGDGLVTFYYTATDAGRAFLAA